MTPVQLPEVPEPAAWAMTDYQPEANTQFTMRVDAAEHYASVGLHVEPLYHAAQLREYATSCVEADRDAMNRRVRALLADLEAEAVNAEDDDDRRFANGIYRSLCAISALLTTPSETNSER